ncbi:efflux RND transporter permease subunit [Bacillus sp. FSL W7-1360]
MKWLLNGLLKRNLVVALAVIATIVFGAWGASKLDMELMPEMSIDQAGVTLYAGSMSALELEEVTKELEQQIDSLDDVDTYYSTTSDGLIELSVVFKEGTVDDAYPALEQVVKSVESDHAKVTESITYSAMGTGDSYFLNFYGENLDELSQKARQMIKPRFEALDEVGSVTVSGAVNREITLKWDDTKLREKGVEPLSIAQRLEEENIGGVLGSINAGDEQVQIRWEEEITNEETLKEIKIRTNNGIEPLGDLVTFSAEGLDDGAAMVWYNGDTNYLSIQLAPSESATDVSLAEAARKELKKIQDEDVLGEAQLTEMIAAGDFITDSIDNVWMNVLIGGALALVILLLFLRHVRATLIMAIAIPTSILLTVGLMWPMGYTINMLSLMGLGLGIGMMVDAAIVILESIFKQMQNGVSRRKAVIDGTREVASAVVASTLTTVVVFIPIAIVGGPMWGIILVLGLVIAIALISSVVISFTVIPVLSNLWLKKSVKHKQHRTKAQVVYAALSGWVTGRMWRSIVVIISFFIMFIVSLVLIFVIPKGLFPTEGGREVQVMVTLEDGVSASEREKTAEAMNELMKNVEGIDENLIIAVSNEMLQVMITLPPEATYDEVYEETVKRFESLEEKHPIVSVGDLMGGGDMTGSGALSVTIQGESLETLTKVGDELVAELEKNDDLRNVGHSMEKQVQTFHVNVDEKALEGAGMVPSEAREAIRLLFDKQPIGMIQSEQGEEVSVYLAPAEKIETKKQLEETEWMTPEGLRPLSDFVSLEEKTAPQQIAHEDGERTLTVSGEYPVMAMDLGAVRALTNEAVSAIDVPDGYEVIQGGDLEELEQAEQDILMILGVAVFLAFVVMAVQFNSMIQPLMVMSVIPVSITGVLLGLFIFQQELNILSGIGMVILVGIILNNAILLVTRINQLREEGMSRHEALVQAGVDRLRPIFMTTLTTAGGMLPLALAIGGSSSYQAPLAIAIISGLLFGTLITLLLIPAVYLVVDTIVSWVKQLFTGKKQGNNLV